jgi:competence protein ComEC
LNFVAILLMALAQIAGLALLPVAAASGAAGDVLGWVAAAAATGIVESASAVEWMPAVAWRVSRPSVWVVVVYYVTGLVAFMAWRMPAALSAGRASFVRWTVSMAAGGAVVWIAAEPWTLWSARGDGHLRVTFLDVGQGDATLLRFPRGTTMLVDAGGSPSEAFDVGDRVVTPTLRHLGVRRLDTLVLSHGDGDHVAGAVTIARLFRPFDVWEGVPVPHSSLLRSVRRAADAAKARWTALQRADETSIDGVRVIVHHPARPDWERQEPRNDDSIVLELRWRDVSIVLPGDIGRDVEAEIGVQFDPTPLRVLKAAHHGSASSSSERWLSQLRPTAAVVSAGRHNTFGHPAPSVLARYASVGTAVYRTDRDGAISLDTDGTRLVVHTVSGRSAVHEARR